MNLKEFVTSSGFKIFLVIAAIVAVFHLDNPVTNWILKTGASLFYKHRNDKGVTGIICRAVCKLFSLLAGKQHFALVMSTAGASQSAFVESGAPVPKGGGGIDWTEW